MNRLEAVLLTATLLSGTVESRDISKLIRYGFKPVFKF